MWGELVNAFHEAVDETEKTFSKPSKKIKRPGSKASGTPRSTAGGDRSFVLIFFCFAVSYQLSYVLFSKII